MLALAAGLVAERRSGRTIGSDGKCQCCWSAQRVWPIVTVPVSMALTRMAAASLHRLLVGRGGNNGPSTAASSCLLIYSDPGYVFAELQPLSRCLRVTLPCSAGRDTIVSSDSTRGGHPFKPVNSRRSRDSLARQAHMPWAGVARALWQSLRFLQIFSAGQLQQNLGLAQRWRHVRTCTCTRDTELQLQFKLQT